MLTSLRHSRMTRCVPRLAVTALFVSLGIVVPVSSAHAAAPANDNFVAAQSITSFPVSGTNVEATLETNEYDYDFDVITMGYTVWFTYAPSTSGLLKLDTCDSNFDTVLVIWENPGSLPEASDTPLASNDDADSPGCGPVDDIDNPVGSQVVFEVNAATTYYIQVGGYQGEGLEEGTFTLSAETVSAASNNNFGNATSVSGSSVSASNFAADMQTLNGADEYNFDGELQASVWFRFTATATGTGYVNTCDAQFDTIVTVWANPTELPLTSDTPLASNDDSESCDSQNPFGSAVSFAVTAGTEYYVQVGNFTAGNFQTEVNQGVFTLSLSAPSASAEDQTPPAWFQSMGRPVDGVCDASQGWVPSWEQWMNDGLGGETCYRVIAWYRGGWAVGNNGGPNGTFQPVEGASVDGISLGSGGRGGGKSGGKR